MSCKQFPNFSVEGIHISSTYEAICMYIFIRIYTEAAYVVSGVIQVTVSDFISLQLLQCHVILIENYFYLPKSKKEGLFPEWYVHIWEELRNLLENSMKQFPPPFFLKSNCIRNILGQKGHQKVWQWMFIEETEYRWILLCVTEVVNIGK